MRRWVAPRGGASLLISTARLLLFLHVHEVPNLVDHTTHRTVILVQPRLAQPLETERANGLFLVLGVADRAFLPRDAQRRHAHWLLVHGLLSSPFLKSGPIHQGEFGSRRGA